MPTAVFIDAGYLDKIMYFDHANARVDYQLLAHELAAPDSLFRAYYYHCMPYQGNPPTAEERQRYASKHRFITAIGNIPRFEIRLGRLAKVGIEQDGKPLFIQKPGALLKMSPALLGKSSPQCRWRHGARASAGFAVQTALRLIHLKR